MQKFYFVTYLLLIISESRIMTSTNSRYLFILLISARCKPKNSGLYKMFPREGAWLAQLVERVTLDLGVVSVSPRLGVEIT